MPDIDKSKEIPTLGFTITNDDGETITSDELSSRYDKSAEDDAISQAKENVARVYGSPEDYYTPYTTPEPKREDFLPEGYKTNTEFLNKMFPFLTKEEEDKRVQQYFDDKRWLSYGKAASALANLIGTRYGASSQEYAKTEVPDITTWRAGEQQKRASHSNASQQLNSTFRNAHNSWLSMKNSAEQQKKNAENRIKSAVMTEANRIRSIRERQDRETESKTGLSRDEINVAWSGLSRKQQTRKKDGSVPNLAQMYDDLVRAKKITTSKSGKIVFSNSAFSGVKSSSESGSSSSAMNAGSVLYGN